MYPIGSILRHHGIDYHIYADDTQLYIKFDLSDPSIALEKINLCISDIRIWMIKNKLKINDSKTEFLVLSSSFFKQQFNDLQINVGNTEINPSLSARNLGVIFDSHLNLESHINSVCRSAYFHLRNIRSIRNMLTDNACSQLIHALVTVRILFKILILTYQAYHKTAPQYLCDLIMPYSNARCLRSDNMSLIAPCHPRAKLKSYGERSFQHAAPTEWNKLPLLIRESPSLDIFKTQLKTFLFKSILEP